MRRVGRYSLGKGRILGVESGLRVVVGEIWRLRLRLFLGFS